MTDTTEPRDDQEVAARALDKLAAFVASLDDDERSVIAALLAPGVATAYAEPDKEVVGFEMGGWSPDRLPESLATQVRGKGIRVQFD